MCDKNQKFPENYLLTKSIVYNMCVYPTSMYIYKTFLKLFKKIKKIT